MVASDTRAHADAIEQNELTTKLLADTAPLQALPAPLRTRDLVVLMTLVVLFVANNSGVQFAGPSVFFYWTLGLLTFLVPGALVTRWLARRFPGPGAPYLWGARVLGARWSFFFAFCLWLPGVLVIVAAIQSSLIFLQYLQPNWFSTPLQQGIMIVLILVIPTAVTCIPLRLLKHILFGGTLLYVGVFALLGIGGIVWLAGGHKAATSLHTPATWMPSPQNFAVFGVIVLAYLGMNIPLFMSGELRGGEQRIRSASRYVWWGSGIVFVCYMLGTFGVMVIVPTAQSGSMQANIIAIQYAFGPGMGTVASIVLSLSQVLLAIAYLLLYSRMMVVMARDQRLPAALARVNRFGVPVLSILVQGGIAALIAVLSLIVLPFLFASFVQPENLALAIYNLLQASTTVIWAFSMFLLFVLVLRIVTRGGRSPAQPPLPRGERIALGVASVVGCLTSLIGAWATISSSWLSKPISNDRWAVLVIGITLVSFIAGLVGSEYPRIYALLAEQRRLNEREKKLRARLEETYHEQQVLGQQYQVLLQEVDQLYREQVLAAITDAVTGLPNHRAIMTRIGEELSRAGRAQLPFAVLFVDLDHFKHVNDTWGHRAGDAVLRQVGSHLREAVRKEDFVGRYGGEEFAILLTGSDLAAAVSVAEKLCKAVEARPRTWYGDDGPVTVQVTASIGVAVYPLHGATRETLIERADSGMYLAKQAGRNCVRVGDIEVEASRERADSSRDFVPVPAQAVQALTSMALAHDRGTGEHARRTIDLCEATARELGYPQEQVYLVRLGALLHDIGKVGIPDAILHKPGKLTEEEWLVMRRHPIIGREVLEQIDGVFRHVAPIVSAHHERWDGAGYPEGLAGQQIPLGARILSVVDAFDAMTSRRVYSEPKSEAEARAELLHCAGTQFDPSVVSAFLTVLDRYEARDTLDIEQTFVINREKSEQSVS